MATSRKKANPEVAEAETQQKQEQATPEKLTDNAESSKSQKMPKVSVQTAIPRNISNAEKLENKLKLESAIEGFRTAAFNSTILKNRVEIVKAISIKGHKVFGISFIDEQGIPVLIPYNKVFQNDPIDYTSVDLSTKEGAEDYLKRQRQLLEPMMNAVIRWIPEAVVEPDDEDGTVTVVGSRTAALTVDRQNYFLSENPNIVENGTYHGRIVVASKHSALVQLGGVEKMIPQFYLTNKYCDDVREIFSPGDIIPITVRNIEIDRENGIVTNVDFDCLTGELMEAQDRIKLMTPGAFTTARISKALNLDSDENSVSRTRLIAWCEAYKAPVKITSVPINRYGVPFKKGDDVTIKVTGRDDAGYPTCYIRSNNGSPSF